MVSVLHETGRRAGWQAELDLAFERRDQRTVMALNRHRGPLQVQKALYPEGPGACHISVLHPPGGIAAGDQLQIQAALRPETHALLTTPGATKWYRSLGERASQSLRFSLGEQASLEWLPRENIFFDRCDVSLELDVDLSPGSKYLGWDIYCFGRRASGETWHRGQLRMRSRIRIGTHLLWCESANIKGDSGFSTSPMGMAGFSVCATFIAAQCAAESVLPQLRAVPAPAKSRVGITALPQILIARYLGDSSEEAFSWFTSLWAVVRPVALGKTAQPPRVWAC
jgi:urease accessory protein